MAIRRRTNPARPLTSSMLLLAMLSASRGDPGDDAPDDRLASARRTFENNCLICHSEELTTASRLTAKQWQAEVDKMVGWGAPVPPEERPSLVDFLASEYPASRPARPPARLSVDSALSLDLPLRPSTAMSGDPARGATLHAAHCATCHGLDARGAELGPNLVEKPILLREEEYSRVVRHGRNRMPGCRIVLDPREEADILAWLRSRPDASAVP